MVRGSCLCRGVAWQVGGELDLMTHCHCSMCRKSHGSAFGTYVAARTTEFRWVRGEGLRTRYESSPRFFRPFCSRCGSVVPDPRAESERTFLPAGNLDDDPGTRPVAHIFVASKAPWYEITDELPQHDAYPPGAGTSVPRPRPSPPTQPGAIRGSCLCGGVRFELEGELSVIIHCHCSRCRKAHSAPHHANVLAHPRQFRWISGEDRVETYKVPEADRFTAAFCRDCGSTLPFPRPGFERLGIPAGALDDDPGARPRLHIFCGSKASWFEISGDLPRFEELPPGVR